jgi:hypothetical protein
VHLEPKRDILANCHPRKNSVFLKNERRCRTNTRCTIPEHNRARCRLEKPGENSKYRGLPTSTGSYEADELSGLRFERHVLKRNHPLRAIVEAMRNVLEPEAELTHLI